MAEIDKVNEFLPGFIQLDDLKKWIPKSFISLTGSLGELSDSGVFDNLNLNATDDKESIGF